MHDAGDPFPECDLPQAAQFFAGLPIAERIPETQAEAIVAHAGCGAADDAVVDEMREAETAGGDQAI